jgi:hypothetical protein
MKRQSVDVPLQRFPRITNNRFSEPFEHSDSMFVLKDAYYRKPKLSKIAYSPYTVNKENERSNIL